MCCTRYECSCSSSSSSRQPMSRGSQARATPRCPDTFTATWKGAPSAREESRYSEYKGRGRGAFGVLLYGRARIGIRAQPTPNPDQTGCVIPTVYTFRLPKLSCIIVQDQHLRGRVPGWRVRCRSGVILRLQFTVRSRLSQLSLLCVGRWDTRARVDVTQQHETRRLSPVHTCSAGHRVDQVWGRRRASPNPWTRAVAMIIRTVRRSILDRSEPVILRCSQFCIAMGRPLHAVRSIAERRPEEEAGHQADDKAAQAEKAQAGTG